jgi:RNA polymerase sigma-70 factor (ECF subfamily)
MDGGANVADLVSAWRAGDNAAGEQLFARHFDSIYNFFSRKIGEDVADLVQHTFLRCVESRDALREDGSVRAYLFAIARNQLYQYFRDRQKNQRLDFSVSSLLDLGESPSAAVARRGDQALLIQALQSIPLELQLVIELHDWEDLTGPQVASVLDLPEGTVRSRLRRALEQLRDAMARLGGDADARWATVDGFEDWARSIRPYEAVVD